jgi:hypothetical protein
MILNSLGSFTHYIVKVGLFVTDLMYRLPAVCFPAEYRPAVTAVPE